MPEGPTKDGQNIIIRNLSQISMTILGLAIAALFGWGQTLSKEVAENKVVIQELKDRISDLSQDIKDNESNLSDLKLSVEYNHDDSRIRITRLEDWQIFHNK